VFEANPLASKKATLSEFKQNKSVKVIKYKDRLYFKENIASKEIIDPDFSVKSSVPNPHVYGPGETGFEARANRIMRAA
jgi:hypothetical protein